MKNISLKMLSILCISIILADFFYNWYFEQLFFNFFLFTIFLKIILLVANIYIFLCSVSHLRYHHKRIQDFLPVVILVSYVAFLFANGEQFMNFNIYKEKRTDMIQMVNEQKLHADTESSMIKLPSEYQNISSNGEAILLSDLNDSLIVGFWLSRGFLDSGFTMVVYAADDNAESIKNGITTVMWPYYNISVQKLEKNWFFVKAQE